MISRFSATFADATKFVSESAQRGLDIFLTEPAEETPLEHLVTGVTFQHGPLRDLTIAAEVQIAGRQCWGANYRRDGQRYLVWTDEGDIPLAAHLGSTHRLSQVSAVVYPERRFNFYDPPICQVELPRGVPLSSVSGEMAASSAIALLKSIVALARRIDASNVTSPFSQLTASNLSLEAGLPHSEIFVDPTTGGITGIVGPTAIWEIDQVRVSPEEELRLTTASVQALGRQLINALPHDLAKSPNLTNVLNGMVESRYPKLSGVLP